MRRQAVFLDRDGTINEQAGYVNHISRFVLLPGTAEAIRLLNSHDYLAIIITNQSGVARGYFPMELVDKVHNHLKDLLRKEGATIDGIFVCPHYPGGEVREYGIDCNCRKPRPGLIQTALENFDIDVSRSYVIGDRNTDMKLAAQCGLKGILVRTGYGMGELEYVLPQSQVKPNHVADDLLDAVLWIIGNARAGES
jgi:D-glycero-D-manno-heptose 1,7-bisphosphate phosphatase